MRQYISTLAAAGLLAAAPGLQAHKAAELYIPIGQSPGLSGKYTLIGEVSAYDRETHTLTVSGDAGPQTVRITESTKIYLDRSFRRQRNAYGTYSDFKGGVTVEVKFVDYERREQAEWIKVRPGSPE